MIGNPLGNVPENAIRRVLALLLGAFSLGAILLWHNIADGDLWARLAVGASVHFTDHVFPRDVFAFTPTLPHWVDHEWGTGVILYSVLEWFGPTGLIALKLILAFMAIGLALSTGRRVRTAALICIAIPCAWTILPGYVPVIRSHAFTYALFALTLWLSNRIYLGQSRLWPALPAIMLLWVNLHGGFVTGFLVMGVFLLAAMVQRGTWRPLLGGTVAAMAVTVLTPYGPRFFSYLIPALLHPRPRITEWGPMPLFGWDAFTGFRVVFLLALVILISVWKRLDSEQRRRAVPGLVLLAITAGAAWAHRRHAPFFGLAAAAFLPPLMQALLDRMPGRIQSKLEPALTLALPLTVTVWVCLSILPGLSLQVLAPVGLFPVRESDILSRSGLSGNLAIPFDWGSYATWRLFPRIKVSIDGRYEETFPESTFEMNERFYNREGDNWDQLIREHQVDFIVIDHRRTKLTVEDLTLHGYDSVWNTPLSSLWAKKNVSAALRQVVAELPDTTIQPLDASIPAVWPWPKG